MSDRAPLVVDPEERLRALLSSGQFLNTVPAGVILQDASGAVVGFNQDAVEILGTTRDDLAGRTLGDASWDTVREDYAHFPLEELPAAKTLATGEPCVGVVMGTENWHQARRWIMANTCRVDLQGGEYGVLSTFVDVTAQIRNRRMLELMAEVNHVVMNASNERDCLQNLCQVMVDSGHYALAWIGVVSPAVPGAVDIPYSAGCTGYLFEGVGSWWGSSASGLGPTGTAIRTSETQVVADLAHQSWDESWRERSEAFGLGAMVAIPLSLGRRRAVLAIYDQNLFAFDDATVERLEGIAREIEFGLVHLRVREQTVTALAEATAANEALRAAEQTLAASEQRFKALIANSSDLIFVLDREGKIRYANTTSINTLSNVDDIDVGPHALEYVHPDDVHRASRDLAEWSRRPGSSRPIVYRVANTAGEWRHLEIVWTNSMDDPAVGGIVVNARDVTERVSLTRALRTLTKSNEILVRAIDERSLLGDICRAIVDSGSYPLAWVGYVSDATDKVVRPVASAGASSYLNGLHVTWGEDPDGRGPTGAAIRERRAQSLADIRESNWPAEGVARAEEYGLRSLCAFPLVVGDQVIGALTILGSTTEAFGAEELDLLQELADDLAFGIASLRDAEQLARSESMLRQAEQRFRLAFESNTAPMVFSDLADRVIAVNDAFCQLVGFTRDELMGNDSKIFTHPDDVGITEETLVRLNHNEVDQVRYTKRYLRKDGRVVITEVSRTPARDEAGRTLYYLASERDITEERALGDQLLHQALHDSVTGLANRALFEDRLDQAIARTSRQGGVGAVLLLDLDEFKAVNDTHGHLTGDELLRGITKRLEAVTRSTDTLGRFGGDEFLYLAEGLSDASEAEDVAKRLLDVLGEPFNFGGLQFVQRASIGIAVWEESVADASALLQNADVALYEAKHMGKNTFAVFNPRMQESVAASFTMGQELRHALSSGELAMHYQPIVDLRTMMVVGFEALMRWRHPERGNVPPDVFIPLAEKSGLILELGEFAMTESVRAASGWPSTHGAAPYVSVNLSVSQFRDPDLVPMIERTLRNADFAPDRLVVEITESVTLYDAAETLAIVERLKRLGVDIALDDFGTGYSSLSYLVRLRPRIIKIDRHFVNPRVESEHNDPLLETIVSLGPKLQMTMLAEGIETAGHLKRLIELNCEMGQGFLFSPAVPADEVAAFLGSPLSVAQASPVAPSAGGRSRASRKAKTSSSARRVGEPDASE